jgi:hypothetical protein
MAVLAQEVAVSVFTITRAQKNFVPKLSAAMKRGHGGKENGVKIAKAVSKRGCRRCQITDIMQG